MHGEINYLLLLLLQAVLDVQKLRGQVPPLWGHMAGCPVVLDQPSIQGLQWPEMGEFK
jgi:hypothetical protein